MKTFMDIAKEHEAEYKAIAAAIMDHGIGMHNGAIYGVIPKRYKFKKYRGCISTRAV